MLKFLDSIIGKILRWVLFLPLSFAILAIVKMFVYAVRFDSWSEYMIEYIPTHCIANGAAFYSAFILIFLVVPNFQKTVAIIFASLFGLIFLASIISPFFFGESLDLEYIPFLPSNGNIEQVSVIGYLSSILGSVFGIAKGVDFISDDDKLQGVIS